MRSRSESQRKRAENVVEVCMEKRGGEERICQQIGSNKEPRIYQGKKKTRKRFKVNEERRFHESCFREAQQESSWKER